MSSAPTRFTSGVTQDASFQPLGQVGIPDPFFYAMFEDDFIHYNTGDYTVTATNGSVAGADGDGGRILFTTGATATNLASIQLKTAPFTVTLGNKLAYLVRFQVADITNTQIVAGLIQTTTTPGTVTNGIYFSKAAASTDIVVKVVSGSTVIGTTTLTGYLTAATDIDLGFYLDRLGNVNIFAGYHLIGNKPNQNVAVLGPVKKILNSSLTAAFPTANLNPTLAVIAGTSAAQTLNADFLYAAKER